jgi:hypothetical protein
MNGRGVLVADERILPKLDSPSIDRLKSLGTWLKFDEIIIAHDVEDREPGTLKALGYEPRLVSLSLLRSRKPVRTTQQVASENHSIDAMLSGRAHQPLIHRVFPVQIG